MSELLGRRHREATAGTQHGVHMANEAGLEPASAGEVAFGLGIAAVYRAGVGNPAFTDNWGLPFDMLFDPRFSPHIETIAGIAYHSANAAAAFWDALLDHWLPWPH